MRQRQLLCAGLVALAALCSGVLSLISFFDPHTDSVAMLTVKAILIWCVGNGISIVYYIVVGCFSVMFGGKETATVSALLDLGGYL